MNKTYPRVFFFPQFAAWAFAFTLLGLFCFVGLQYNYEGRYDLVKFVKIVQKAGLFVHVVRALCLCTMEFWVTKIYYLLFFFFSLPLGLFNFSDLCVLGVSL